MASSNLQDSRAFEAIASVSVAHFTAFSYDWLLSISEEHKVVSRAGPTWPITIYLLSRIATAVHLLMTVLFLFAPTGHCSPLTTFLAVCAVTRVLSTSFLFLLRVRAVYQRSTSVTALFSILWLTTAALNIFTNASMRAAPLNDTQYCTYFQIQHSTYPSNSSFVFDTSVFIAISYRLAADAATEKGWRTRLQSIVTGKGLFSVSRALMISGQLYYLATILYFWVNIAVMVSPLVPANYHSVLTASYITFTNIMACRVFRGVALGMLEKSPTTAGLSSTQIAAAFELAPVASERGATREVP
ncbi:hypothetical protein FIBSPDRAFT_947163 [Athelia psychrophila]|uniref:G-protein coupled receptors family 1 profile domain-containing protein n=1 Tax=Athelia psychrophila TaxID=1759441 RepID=A0A166S8Y3_9AGAM|nr:hypothetical protein FIBSPDRAFT_947163 [Fibularhizoctonia sp. CBS 109695]